MPTKILVVCGSTRTSSRSRLLSDFAAESVRAAGAEAEVLDLRELVLPVMRADDAAQSDLPQVREARQAAAEAHGFVLVTPEYHGNVSGALKNWLDYLRQELAGKLAAIITVSGGFGGDMSTTSTRNSLNWCHAFVLPFAANAHQSDFGDGVVASSKIRERIQRLTRDVVRYSPILLAAFEEAKTLGDGVESGLAGLHLGDED